MKLISFVLLSLCSISFSLYAQDSKTNNIKVPDGISLDGVPPIPGSIIEGIKPYTESRFAYLQDWHPLRKEMLIITELGNTIQTYIIKMPGGMRTQATFDYEPVNQSLFDPKKGEYIITVKDIGGNEYMQIFRHELSTGKSVLLTSGSKSNNFVIGWNTKGDKLYYQSLKEDESTAQVYVVDPKTPGSNHLLISLEGPNWNIQAINQDDRSLLLSSTSEGSNTENKLWLYELESKQKSQLLPQKAAKGSYQSVGFSKEGTGFYLLTNQGSDFLQLAFYNLRSNQLNILTHFKWDIRRAYISPDKNKIAFTVNEAGNTRPYIFYTASNKYLPIQGLPIGFLSGMIWTSDSESLGFQLSTSFANSDIYEWNSKTGKLVPWVQCEMGGIDASTIPAPQMVKWKSFDGLEISGFLYPANKKFKGKRPVIIDIHGGPVFQALPLYNSKTNYYTNELGIVVISPNIRGSAGFGKTFEELDNGVKKEDALKDIGTLLDWIASQPGLDADRIMVTGGSYGGYMTYRTSIEYNKKIRCAVEAFGISDFISYKNNVDTAHREFVAHEYGDDTDPAIRDYFNRISPLKNANKITMPIFIIQGKNDPRVPYTESQQMVNEIKKNGGTVWYLLANDEGHGFMKKANDDYLFYSTVEFIKKYLLN